MTLEKSEKSFVEVKEVIQVTHFLLINITFIDAMDMVGSSVVRQSGLEYAAQPMLVTKGHGVRRRTIEVMGVRRRNVGERAHPIILI